MSMSVINNESLYAKVPYDQSSDLGSIQSKMNTIQENGTVCFSAMAASLSQTALAVFVTAPIIEYSKILSARGTPSILTGAISLAASSVEVASLVVALPEAALRTALYVGIYVVGLASKLFGCEYDASLMLKQQMSLISLALHYPVQFALEALTRMLVTLVTAGRE